MNAKFTLDIDDLFFVPGVHRIGMTNVVINHSVQ